MGNIAEAMDCVDVKAAAAKFDSILNSLSLEIPKLSEEDYKILQG